MVSLSLPALSAALLLVPAAFAASDASTCGALKATSFPDTTLTASETVTPSALAALSMKPAPATPTFCRVRGILHPTGDSVIRFEVWLPEDQWNGRLLNVGNGGFAGSLYYGQMLDNLGRGYATAGSDAGHQAEAEDASWAYRHPEKIADFGYRAVHLTAGVSKTLVKAFYTREPAKTYFDACSDGGREALMEAQRFPEDYDGILAGAPANNWTHMITSGLALAQVLARDPAAYISANKLPAIKAAALAACDAGDGLKDGIISDPESCHFDPAVLACKAAEDNTCLTPPQVQSLRALYAGGKGKDGRSLFPGLTPGDEDPAWHDWVLGNAPAGASGTNYMSGFFRYMVLSDPTWNPLTADVDQTLQAAMSHTAKDVDATDPDLSRFAARGGKLIVYHGWNDPAISPWNSVNYYRAVRSTMGDAKADTMLRLYMVPGMEHCSGGPGPNTFGQLGTPAVEEGKGALDALRAWVETGQAPGPLPAVKTTGPHDAPQRTIRPICPYPQATKYDGKGEPGDAKSFSCGAASRDTP